MLRVALKSCLHLGLSAIPTPIYRRLFPRDVIGLCYHMVTDEYPTHVAHISSYKTSAQFEADLQYLTKHYEVISYEELLRRRQVTGDRCQVSGKSHSPALDTRHSTLASSASRRPAAIVTFDDGYRECFDVVRPLLLKYEVPAIFFVTTDFIDNRRMFYRNKVSLCVERILGLSETQCRELAKRIRPHGTIDGITNSHPAPDTRHLTPDAFIRWLKGLAFGDEPVIDEVCSLLEIDIDDHLQSERPYLTADETKQLSETGFTIGAHGVTHTALSDQLRTVHRAESEERREKRPEPRAGGLEEGSGEAGNGRTAGQASTRHPASSIPNPTTVSSPPPAPGHLAAFDSEVVESCRRIGEITGAVSVPFAFPFGASGIPLDLIEEVYEEHAELGLIFDSRGLLPGPACLVQRISSDDIGVEERRSSSLPRLISQEYQIQLRRSLIEPAKRKLSVIRGQ